MKIEKKPAAVLLALFALAVISVPSVFFAEALTKYFGFISSWNTAVLKPSRPVSLPPPPLRSSAQAKKTAAPKIKFVKFSAKLQGAKKVFLVGDFNNWQETAIPMKKNDRGAWEITLPLPPGRYRYLYNADGKQTKDAANSKTAVKGETETSLILVE